MNGKVHGIICRYLDKTDKELIPSLFSCKNSAHAFSLFKANTLRIVPKSSR